MLEDIELFKSIITAKEELEVAIKNFEIADNDLVDYYSYQIKASKAKLDYLIKIVKSKSLKLNMVNQIKIINE